MRPKTRLTALLLSAFFATAPLAGHAASHREAPLIAQDPAADITDVYAFVNYNDPEKVTFIMNVIPGQEPGSGPNYFFFDDNVLYAIHLDLDRDGKAEDLTFEIRFKTELRNVLSGVGLQSVVANVGRPDLPLTGVTALDGPGSEGLGIRQFYTVTMVKKGEGKSRTELKSTDGPLIAVPSRQGPFTMPDYEGLAAQGIRSLDNGIRVFAGQRDETFYIDLGAVFDGPLNLRSPGVLSDAEDANDNQNSAGVGTNPAPVDMFSGFNVNTIAIEVPKSLVMPKQGTVIGLYASTSRPKITVLRTDKSDDRNSDDRNDDDQEDGKDNSRGKFAQVSRMANPLVNELIIRFLDKDRWNATDPEDEQQFIADYQAPTLASVLNLLFKIPVPPAPRNDLVSVLLQYPGDKPGEISELLRLDLNVAPTAAEAQKRLTVLAHNAAGEPTPDPAGWPNGRRPNDDVTDIALRVVSGVLVPGFGNARLGDGANFNICAPGTGITPNGIAINFPFLPTPHDGRNRRHIDPGESPSPCLF
jgi:hypothetical protein